MEASDEKPRDDEIDVFGSTHVGHVREENEDNFLLCSLRKQMLVHYTSLPDLEKLGRDSERLAFLGLVADGLGGQAAGEEASRTALETIAEYVTHSMRCYYTSDAEEEREFLEDLERSVLRCHENVRAEAEKHPDRRGMATTLTLVMTIWPRAYIVQVGDSRCYHLHQGELHQITRDQTLAQDLIDQGLMPREEAADSQLHNVLSSAIGGADARPVVSKVVLDRDDSLLLCTDGLTKHVSDKEIRDRLLGFEKAEEVCRTLITDALAGGGTDNVTVIVGRLKNPASSV